PERIDFQGVISAVDDPAREPGDRVRIAVRLVPTVRVRRHAIAHAAAEELPDGNAKGLADDVPARHLERGERRLRDFLRPPVVGAKDVPRQTLDVERTRTNHVARRELSDT